MFESSYETLLEQIDTIVSAASFGETVRAYTFELHETGAKNEFDNTLMNLAPASSQWRIYNHCGTITRLYSVFEVFMSSFVRDVCEALPFCVRPYSALPERTQKAHRLGLGKIILEIEEKRYHQNLKQRDLIASYLESISDNEPYKLIADAFVVTKSALRFQRVLTILASIGFDEIEQKILSHRIIKRHLGTAKTAEERKEVIQLRLNEFVDVRNEASHAEITDIWPIERHRELAYFIRDLCMVIVEIGEGTFVQRHLDAGLLTKLGEVTEAYGGGETLVVQCTGCTVSVGDELILSREGIAYPGSVTSIQTENVDVRRATLNDPAQLGVRLTVTGRVKDELYGRSEVLISSRIELPDAEQDGEETEPDGSSLFDQEFD